MKSDHYKDTHTLQWSDVGICMIGINNISVQRLQSNEKQAWQQHSVRIVSEDHDAAGYGKRMCMIKSTEEAQGFVIEDELDCYTQVTTMDMTRRIGRHCV